MKEAREALRFARGAAIEVVAPARTRSDPSAPNVPRTSTLVGIPTVGFIATVAITAGSSQSTADTDVGIGAREDARRGSALQTGRPMSLSEAEREHLLDSWPVARLATVAASGRPQLVPIVFARAGGALWSPIDGKLKTGGGLARVRNIERDPRVALLLDHYADDWQQLWWLRVDGRASLCGGDAGAEAALRAKYPQYRDVPLFAGEPRLLRIDPERILTWASSSR
jgi:PPOX class probable F420-dependent enzyme